MTLNNHFENVLSKLELGEFTIKTKKNINKKLIDSKHLYLESINFLMYEWCLDHGQRKRASILFDYIVIPKKIKRKEFDFTSITFDDFFNFLVSIKNTSNKITHEKRKLKPQFEIHTKEDAKELMTHLQNESYPKNKLKSTIKKLTNKEFHTHPYFDKIVNKLSKN
jgi:SHS2 domain-containing protein